MKHPFPLLALALALSSGIGAEAREPSLNDLLAIGEQAVLAVPPSVVADYAERGVWSQDGRYVLTWRNAIRLPFNLNGEAPPVDSGLWLWSAQSGKCREVWLSRLQHQQNSPIGWLSGTSIALTTVDVPPSQPNPAVKNQADRWIARIDARTGSVKLTARVQDYDSIQIAPRVPYAVGRDTEGRLRLIKSDGMLGQEILLPGGERPSVPFWGSDGATLLIGSFSQEKQALVGQVFGFDPRTGKVRPVDSPAAVWRDPEPAGALRLLHSRGDLRDGPQSVALKPLWLTARDGARTERTLIAPDTDWAKLSPAGDAVLYLQDGALLVRRLVSLPKTALTQAREAALRSTVMSDCRQIGLALIIHANRHDEQLPAQGEPIDAIIIEAVKSETIALGFIYTFPGGKLTDIQEPSKTILGYKLGPGGRANLFADGHVAWEAEP